MSDAPRTVLIGRSVLFLFVKSKVSFKMYNISFEKGFESLCTNNKHNVLQPL